MSFKDLLYAQGSKGTDGWKLKCTKKVFDPIMKGYAFDLCDSSNSRIEYSFGNPSSLNSEVSLSFIILQAYLQKDADFSFTVNLSVSSAILKSARRVRLLFSTSFGQLRTDPLHTQIPLKNIPREIWVNIKCDLSSFLADKIHSIDSILVCPAVRIRRLCMVSNKCGSNLPQHLAFPINVVFTEILIDSEAFSSSSTMPISIATTFEKSTKMKLCSPDSSRKQMGSSRVPSPPIENTGFLCPSSSDKIQRFSEEVPTVNSHPKVDDLGLACPPEESFVFEDNDVVCSEVTSMVLIQSQLDVPGTSYHSKLRDEIDRQYKEIKRVLGIDP
jgi:hypothetical protein